MNNLLKKSIQSAGRLTQKAIHIAGKATKKAMPAAKAVAREFKEGFTSEDGGDARLPTIIYPKNPKGYTADGDIGVCNTCMGPYENGNCMTYDCIKH